MTVHVDERGAVVIVTIDRPDRRNAVDYDTLVELRRIQGEIAGSAARCLVLTGAPPAFCAGADLVGVESGAFVDVLGDVLRGFTELSIPTVAAVDGAALGAGTQLAVACDLRIATARSVFGIPAAKLGLAVDQWTVNRVTMEFGPAVGRAMLIAAQIYDTAQLVGTGGVHRVGSLDDACEWATELAGLAPLTIAAHKLALESAAAAAQPVDAAVERARAQAWASADAEEGRAAFLAKRPPDFSGR